ncbi:hypothetical protein [Phenylobacterium sp.]|jgi:hypothetical protein|uniref:hypothetical protein n=1 Tax=Phenylobacterium sp. TaxID=1871053 RepID=UPI002F3F3892
MNRNLAVLAALALCGCAHAPAPKIVTQLVKVPVAAACAPKDFRAPPATADTDAALRAAPGPAERYQLIAAGRLLKNQWITEAWSVLAACR